jgi:hypothetical protein
MHGPVDKDWFFYHLEWVDGNLEGCFTNIDVK